MPSPQQFIKQVSITELHNLTGHTRDLISKKLSLLTYTPGTGTERLYNAREALRAIYLGEGMVLTAQDKLAEKRTEEIELNMETARKERIPLEAVEEHNETVLRNCAGIIKSREGKILTAEGVQEFLTEMRRMGEVLKGYVRKQVAPEEREITWEDL